MKIWLAKNKKSLLIRGLAFFVLTLSFSIFSQTAFATGDITTGLVAHYKMNDNAANTTVVDNIGGYTGTAVHNTNLLATSKINSALSFNGSSDKVTTAGNIGISGSTARSVAFWIFRTNASDFPVLEYGANSSHNGFHITICGTAGSSCGGGDHIYFDPTYDGGASTSTVSAGVWHHVVLTINASSLLKFYVDGSYTGQSSLPVLSTTDSTLKIGYSAFWAEYGGGYLDDFRIYNTDLSAGTVSSLYNSGLGTESEAGALGTNLVAHYLMNDNAASTVVLDTTGNHNGASVQNTNLLATSRINSALNFDGTSDYVSVSNNAALNFGATDSFSINAWVKTTDQDGFIVHKQNDKGYDLYIGASSLPRYEIYDGTHVAQATPGSTSVGGSIWHMVTMITNRSLQQGSIYIDGSLQGSPVSISSVGSIVDSGSLSIGAGASHNDKLAGIVDDVRIYSRALAAGDITSLYNSGAGTETDTAVANTNKYWVGTNGSWNTAANWASTSGGSDAVGVPVAGDTVYFDGGGNHDANIDANATFGSLQINSGFTHTVTQTSSYTITASTTISQNSSGSTLILINSNTIPNGVTLTAGTLNINSATAIGTSTLTIAGGTIDNTSGGAVTLSTNNAQSWNADFTFGGSNNLNLGTGTVSLAADRIVTTNGSAPLSVGGMIAGAYALTKAGTGTLLLSGASTYTGLTTISAGTLKLGLAGSGGNTPLGTVAAGTSVTAGATLDLNGYTLSTAEALTLNGTGISGGGALSNSSSTAVTYSGLLTLGSASSIIATSGNMTISNTGTITGATFGLTLGGTNTGSSLASILGMTSGTLTKAGTGTWTLSGASTFTGGTTLSAGTLVISTTTALGVGDFTQSGGVFTGGSGDITITGTTTLSSGTFNSTSGNLSIAGNFTNSGATFVANSGTVTFTGTNASITPGSTSFYKVSFGAASSLGTGLVAHYKMNDNAANTTVVDNIGGYTGTAVHNTNLLATSKINSALSFNGSSDVISMGTPQLLEGTSHFTISAWVKMGDLSNAGGIVSERTSGNDSWVLNGGSAFDMAIFTTAGAGYYPVDSSAGKAINTWYNVVTTYDGSKLIMYVNGTQEGSTTAIGNIQTSSAPLTIGQTWSSGVHFNGTIDDVRIYSSALSSGDVSSLYNSGLGTESEAGALGTNLVAHYLMNDNAASTVVLDTTGNHNGASVQNTNLLATSKINSALSFNGSNDYIHSTLNVPSSNGSVSFWAYLTAYNNMFISTTPGNQFAFQLFPGTSYYGVYNSGDYRVVGNYLPTLNTWTLVTFTWNSTTGSVLYFNGTVQGTNPTPPPALTDTGFYLGSDVGVSYFTNGKMDDFRIYSRALTGPADNCTSHPSNDVCTLYNSGAGTEAETGSGTSTLLGNLTATSDITINSGCTLSAGAYSITEGGNWTNSGTFTAGTGTTTFNGTNQSLTGATTFYNLVKSVTSADTLTFAANSTTTIAANGSLTLTGTAGNLLSLRSSVSSTTWKLNVNALATSSLNYLDVKDSDASGGRALSSGNSTNSGNNTNWTFVLPILTVGKSGSQVATTTLPVTNLNLGGAFTFLKNLGTSTITSITLHQIGSLPATDITHLQLWSKASTTCSALKPSGTTQFGTGSTTFTNGYATTTGSLDVGPTTNVCLYTTYDIPTALSLNLLGYSIDPEITNPATDVTVAGATVSPTSRVNIPGYTIVIQDNSTVASSSPSTSPTAPITATAPSCLTNQITSVLSLKMADPAQNPTVYYLKNCSIWKQAGGGNPERLTNPNLIIQSLTFTNVTPVGSPGSVRLQLTISNVATGTPDSFLNVTRSYGTTANVNTNGGN